LTAPDPAARGRPEALLGRFLEIGIATTDIRASVEFYERLGFTQAHTGDVWMHPYGVLTDGRVCLGLHQTPLQSPLLTFVRPGLAAQLTALERAGVEPLQAALGAEVFNQVSFQDPAGQPVRLLEARTFSPAERSAREPSRCGEFAGLSLPAAHFGPVVDFWQALGFEAAEEAAAPFPHVPLRGAGLQLRLHRPRFFAEPLLVFRDPQMRGRIAQLRDSDAGPMQRPPRGLDPKASALLLAPEGTVLLLLEDPAPG
jgi:catechol 2,3-dioxygenase-like lactoylglutathione lyase family enzyme